MKFRLTGLFISLALIFLLGCPSADGTENPGGSSQVEQPATGDFTAQASTDEEEMDGDLPFQLSINNQIIGPDLIAVVPENTPAPIEFVSSMHLDGELSIVPAGGGSAIALGTWTGSTASFTYMFGYGENHALLKIGDDVYDITIVAGVNESASDPGSVSGCPNSFMNLAMGNEWDYQEHSEVSITTYWTYSIQDVTNSADGTISLTMRMTATQGIEKKEITAVSLNIVCDGENSYLVSALEQKEDFTNSTVYDPRTIFMPAEIEQGTKWTRTGVSTIVTGGDSYDVNLVEEFECIGVESINVAAGEFSAHRVEFAITGEGSDLDYTNTGTSWYVPRIGRILMIGENGELPRRELVSYRIQSEIQ